MENFDLGAIAITFVVFLFSTACHEAAHASMAYWWGDPTGREAGQMSLNPLPHIQREPFGMVVIPLLMLLQSGGSMLMGWASTPVNIGRMRDVKWGNFWTSAAGPLMNLLLAIIFGLLLKLASSKMGASLGEMQGAVSQFLWVGVNLNIVLMVLNFLPVPPLDGGSMVESLLPYNAAQMFAQIRPYGIIILIMLSFTGVFWNIVTPIQLFAHRLLQ